jgi:hypothetical protein
MVCLGDVVLKTIFPFFQCDIELMVGMMHIGFRSPGQGFFQVRDLEPKLSEMPPLFELQTSVSV